MENKLELIKSYLYDMGFDIQFEEKEEELVIVSDEESGICDLVLDCEDPILVMEQIIMKTPASNHDEMFKRLLQMNREIVHGAFALDNEGEFIIFRDTLQLENLDRNELEGSIRSLELAMSEYGEELIEMSKN
jgi:hypothetical protein